MVCCVDGLPICGAYVVDAGFVVLTCWLGLFEIVVLCMCCFYGWVVWLPKCYACCLIVLNHL